MQLTTNVLGSFILRDGRVIKQKLFSGSPKDIAARLRKTEESWCQEEEDLLRELAETGNKKVYVSNPARFRGIGFKIAFLEERERVPVHKLAGDLGLSKADLDPLIRRVNRALTRERLREVERDQVLIQAVNSLDDIDEAVNRLVERLREWYSLHFPELDNLVASHETYVGLVTGVGDRKGFANPPSGLDPGFGERISQASKDSLGVEFTGDDLKSVKDYAEPIVRLYEVKEGIEGYVGDLMSEVAPNLSVLAGPLLGARLISHAHSLKRLATLPAGTIQILGAEDAFFRFLKTGKKPPKHGIIFQYPAIRGAKRGIRGKLARTFAAKVAIAARADAYKGSKVGEKLKKDFEKRVKSLN